MRSARVIHVVVMAYIGAAAVASAQRTTRGVYVDIGGILTIKDLNSAGTEFLSGGPVLGGGLFWEPFPEDSTLRIQGDFAWNRQTFHTPKATDGTKVDMSMVGINLDYIYWTHRKWALTLAGGGGAAFLHVWDTTGVVRARPFARIGFGARYVANRRVQYLLQTYGIIYDIRNFPTTSVLGPFNRRQTDVGFNLGVSLNL